MSDRSWNLTACAPELAAASIKEIADSKLPLWLTPISATINMEGVSEVIKWDEILNREREL